MPPSTSSASHARISFLVHDKGDTVQRAEMLLQEPQGSAQVRLGEPGVQTPGFLALPQTMQVGLGHDTCMAVAPKTATAELLEQKEKMHKRERCQEA